ncbi:WD domain-containing protein [Bisporella sp. PMI_857]|nr:WD domain-containing protein [Bisporella sp. PMI_857]
MSSFFAKPRSDNKRKRPDTNEAPKKRFAASKPSRQSKPAPRKPQRDESISGSDDESEDGGRARSEDLEGEGSSSDGEGEDETAADKRRRLAEQYLENVRQEVDAVGFDAEEIDRDLIAERLQEDVAESKGRMYRKLAEELTFESASHSIFKCNTQSFTSVATCPPYAYTATKDLCLIKWRIQDLPKDQYPGKKTKSRQAPPRKKPVQVAFAKGNREKVKDKTTYQGHVDNILTVAASPDGKYVVTGGRDRRIVVWDANNLTVLRVFQQHRDSVTGLAFRRGSNQLYSSSKDRTIKIWSLDTMAYVETLFGHQDEAVDVATLAKENCISVGARDRTARYWKVVEETQLVFRGGGGDKKKSGTTPRVLEGSIDRVAMVDEEMFVTGGDNGGISLWTIHKKKPVHTLYLTHGTDPAMKPDEASAETRPDPKVIPTPQPRWITALATIPFSDVILSGSWDGHVRAWRVSNDKKKIEPLGIVGAPSLAQNGLSNGNSSSMPEPLPIIKGVINDISVFERGDRGKDGVCIVAAVGKEHRFGRWKKIEQGRNGAMVFEVPRIEKSTSNGVSEGADADDES